MRFKTGNCTGTANTMQCTNFKIHDSIKHNNNTFCTLIIISFVQCTIKCLKLKKSQNSSCTKIKLKFADINFVDLGTVRWRSEKILLNSYDKILSLRTPIEWNFAYSKLPIFKTKENFQQNVTCLDISEMKICKLDGIENLINLSLLNVSRNRITSLQKLKTLGNLSYLDASSNKIYKGEDLPLNLLELNLSNNSLTCLNFCAKLQQLRKLNLKANRIKTLKGLESVRELEMLILSCNLIRDRNEIDICSNFIKLSIVDLSENLIVEMESLRDRLVIICQSLISINNEHVAKQEKNLVQRKPGKVLTLEHLERNFNMEKCVSLNLAYQQFRLVVLDKLAVAKLNHVTAIDLSNNALEHIYELTNLSTLKSLNISHNSIISLSADSNDFSNLHQNTISQLLTGLENLDLSFNNINNQSLNQIGLARLPKIKMLNLSNNQLTRMDFEIFDIETLQELNLSCNEIKAFIRKKALNNLKVLNLSENKLKNIDGLCCESLIKLDISNNKIITCAAIKTISHLKELEELFCMGNTVTERRVYVDFILNSIPKLKILNGMLKENVHLNTNLMKTSVSSNFINLTIQDENNEDYQKQEKLFRKNIKSIAPNAINNNASNISFFPTKQSHDLQLSCEQYAEGTFPEKSFCFEIESKKNTVEKFSSSNITKTKHKQIGLLLSRHKFLTRRGRTLSPTYKLRVSGIKVNTLKVLK